MLTKDIVKEIKSVKGTDRFSAELNSRWTGSLPPSEFNRVVTECILVVCPHLAPMLHLSPITNGTANAVAGKLDK